MRRWERVLLYALFLLILSALFVPVSHTSLAQFAKEFLIRRAFTVAFAAATFRVLQSGAVESYRITETSPELPADEDALPIDLQEAAEMPQPKLPSKRRRSFLVFWIVVFAIYCLTRTQWWGHLPWVSRFMELAIRWTILLACWGFLLLLWMPKPGADRPEPYHVTPRDDARPDAPKSTN